MVNILKQARKKNHTAISIPQPYEDVPSLYRTVLATKELVETLAGQRGQAYDIAITWQDLLDLQLIRKEDIPYNIGSHPL
jgi:hypothetical protein